MGGLQDFSFHLSEIADFVAKSSGTKATRKSIFFYALLYGIEAKVLQI
jgi:hypothetical protein